MHLAQSQKCAVSSRVLIVMQLYMYIIHMQCMHNIYSTSKVWHDTLYTIVVVLFPCDVYTGSSGLLLNCVGLSKGVYGVPVSLCPSPQSSQRVLVCQSVCQSVCLSVRQLSVCLSVSCLCT